MEGYQMIERTPEIEDREFLAIQDKKLEHGRETHYGDYTDIENILMYDSQFRAYIKGCHP